MRTVEATIDPRNVWSIALVERLGFVWTATDQGASELDGIASDDAVYRWIAPR